MRFKGTLRDLPPSALVSVGAHLNFERAFRFNLFLLIFTHFSSNLLPCFFSLVYKKNLFIKNIIKLALENEKETMYTPYSILFLHPIEIKTVHN